VNKKMSKLSPREGLLIAGISSGAFTNNSKISYFPSLVTCLSIFIFLTSLLTAIADDEQTVTLKDKIAWTDECRIHHTAIKIQAVSKSGELPEDDSDVFIIQDGKELKIPIAPAWYDFVGVLSDKKSCASKLPVFQIGSDKVLIILSPDNRPFFRETSFVLYNFISNKVLDVKERVGEIKECSEQATLVVMSHGKDAYKIRLVKEYLQLTDGPEDYIEGWMKISVSGEKMKYQWLE
jgi:hypothetical protein